MLFTKERSDLFLYARTWDSCCLLDQKYVLKCLCSVCLTGTKNMAGHGVPNDLASLMTGLRLCQEWAEKAIECTNPGTFAPARLKHCVRG